MRVRVGAGGRLHFGFQNLSLAHERLYGGVGVALAEPRVELTAEPAESVVCSDPLVADCAAAACELLGVEGVRVAVEETVPRHVGLGSGTQAALATLAAVARAHDRPPEVRQRACVPLPSPTCRGTVSSTVTRTPSTPSSSHAAAAQSATSGSEQTTDSAGSAVNSTRGSARATPTPP